MSITSIGMLQLIDEHRLTDNTVEDAT
jgi:hypothetical protein